jgi:8-oxo-dGTP diphosphatase
MKRYVVGFLFSPNGKRLVLIMKRRPAWQKDLLNGPGGHIEDGETPEEAMEREFREEAKLSINSWEKVVILRGSNFEVHFFRAFDRMWHAVGNGTDEEVRVVGSARLPDNVIPNLKWIVPMCLDTCIKVPVIIEDMTPNGD